MGNRATVIFTDGKANFSPAIYLHWNGGPESIYAFLAESERRGVNGNFDGPTARFIQLIGEFFDQGSENPKHDCLSLGVVNGPKSAKIADLEKVDTDQSNNGLYLVNWTKTGLSMRRFLLLLPDHHLVEQTPEWVAAERKAALAHEYATGLNEFYLGLDEKLGIKPAAEPTHDFGNGPVPAHRHVNGGGWVAETARVDETAYVGRYATVFERAIVTDGAQIHGRAKVFGHAHFCGNREASGNDRIADQITVTDIEGNTAVFHVGSEISGNPSVDETNKETLKRVEFQAAVRAKMKQQNGVAAKPAPAPLPGASLTPASEIGHG